MIRLVAAFLIIPLLLQAQYFIPPYGTYTFWWLRLMLVIGYLVMALFGIPLVWLFVRKGWTSWWQCVAGALIAVSLFLVLWFLTSGWAYFVASGLGLCLFSWALAAIGGIAFWFIAFWRNPRFVVA